MSSIMKRWEMAAAGRENLVLRDAVVPAPKAGEVLVRVRAVSLNFRDKLVVSGGAGASFTLPLTPASDMAGTIVGLGEGASRFAVGDRVISTFIPEWIDGLPPGDAKTPPHRTLGGFFQGVLAQYVVFPQSWLVRAPKSLSDVEASTLPCAGLTAWFALVERGGVKEGDIVLVEGTGGVALFGMQIAKAQGARVIVTSSSDEKLARAKELGADDGINYAEQDWVERLLQLTQNHGADHILELVGGPHLGKSVRAGAIGGRIYQIGFLEGFDASLPAAPLMFKNMSIHGIGAGHRRALEDLVTAVDRQGLLPVVDAIYPLPELPVALDHLERGSFGKIVIDLFD